VSLAEIINFFVLIAGAVAYKEVPPLFQEPSDAERRSFHKLSPNIRTVILLFMSVVESVETRYVPSVVYSL
jgi:hypothetical protein